MRVSIPPTPHCPSLNSSYRPDISKYWKITFEDQHCPVYEPKHILAAGILSAITDLIVVLLPIPTVIGVKMPFRVTLIVLCLFGAGFLATGVGAARIYFTRRVNLSNDKTWDVFPSNVTSLIELYIGIVSPLLFTSTLSTLTLPDLRLHSRNKKVLQQVLATYPPHPHQHPLLLQRDLL